ncbi:MAG: precorrin-2 C(20)-methyltransferase [Spirochaetia bacterium]|nr:precorrin-2 C(20)-methyltransferase [Spirochaetia bacterium]
MNEKRGTGILYGIGAGPGDPELITMKGYRILQETGVIAFPEAKKGGGSYAGNMAESLVDKNKKTFVPLTFPMTKDPARLNEEWEMAVATLREPLEAGKNVAFVSEGDPLFYSTFIHLMEKMRKWNPDLKIEIVPGISAVHGASASLGWGLVNADQKFAVIPATENMREMADELDRHDVVVFYKVAKVIQPVIQLLKSKNLMQCAAAVSKTTSPDEKIYLNLNDIPIEGLPYLSLLIVRKTENTEILIK